MNIKLYPSAEGSADTRPLGNYEWCQSAVVRPGTLLFYSQSGVKILTNLHYKITLLDEDVCQYRSTQNPVEHGYDIVGTPKPAAEKSSRKKKELTQNGTQKFDFSSNAHVAHGAGIRAKPCPLNSRALWG